MTVTVPPRQREHVRRLASRTVRVEYGKESIGTGVIIGSRGIVLTAAHVVAGTEPVSVRCCSLSASGRLVYARRRHACDVAYADAALDIALLAMREPPERLRVAKLGDSDRIRPDSPLWRIGMDTVPVASGWLVERVFLDRQLFFKIGMPAQPGSSGGPIFGEDRRLVAIALRYHTPATEPEASYALPINVVNARLLAVDAVRALLDGR